MIIFLDTSSIFKLYHKEIDTPALIQFMAEKKVTKIFLSEIAKIEFASIIWRKVRMNEFTESEAQEIIILFRKDFIKYHFIRAEDTLMEAAFNLLGAYGKQGLRTLDSIQLATAIFLKNECELFITTDKLLNSFFKQESLPVL